MCEGHAGATKLPSWGCAKVMRVRLNAQRKVYLTCARCRLSGAQRPGAHCGGTKVSRTHTHTQRQNAQRKVYPTCVRCRSRGAHRLGAHCGGGVGGKLLARPCARVYARVGAPVRACVGVRTSACASTYQVVRTGMCIRLQTHRIQCAPYPPENLSELNPPSATPRWPLRQPLIK